MHRTAPIPSTLQNSAPPLLRAKGAQLCQFENTKGTADVLVRLGLLVIVAVAVLVPIRVRLLLLVGDAVGLLLGLFVCDGVFDRVPLLLLVTEGVAVGVHVTLRVTLGVRLGVMVADGESVCVGDHDEPSGSSGGSDGHGVPCGDADAAAVAPLPPSVITQLRPKEPDTAKSASTTTNIVCGSGGVKRSPLARQASTVFMVILGAQ